MGERVLLVAARQEEQEEQVVKEEEGQQEEQVAQQIPANKIMEWQDLSVQVEMEVVDQAVVPEETNVLATMLA